MDATVFLDRFADLSEDDRLEVRTLSAAVYPPDVLANWPGRHLEWSTAAWSVRVRGSDGQLVSYVGAVVRDGLLDGRAVQIGGIGGVKTHPAARGRGYAAAGIRRAVEFFQARGDVVFALLVCEPSLLAYYGKLGWREFGGTLLVRQFGAMAEYTFSRVMTLGIANDAPLAGTIDLCGPPW